MHPTNVDSIIVTEKLRSAEVVLHRLLEQDLRPGLPQYCAKIKQVILPISDSGCEVHFFCYYKDRGIESDAGCAYCVTKDGKELVGVIYRNLRGCFGYRTGLDNSFLADLSDAFVCCF